MSSDYYFAASRPDGRSDRQVIVDFVAPKQQGDVISHDELITELQNGTDREITQRHIYSAVPAACRVLIREHSMALISLPGDGYRIAEPDEWFQLANQRRRRAARETIKGTELIVHSPRGKMSPETRNRVDAMQVQIAQAQAILSHHAIKHRRHEQAIASLTKRHEQAVASLTKRVDKLEGKPETETVDGTATEDTT